MKFRFISGKVTVAILAVSLVVSFFLLGKALTSVSASTPQCKHLNSECEINNSEKTCCEGLVCGDFNEHSGNGKCELAPTPTPTATPTLVP